MEVTMRKVSITLLVLAFVAMSVSSSLARTLPRVWYADPAPTDITVDGPLPLAEVRIPLPDKEFYQGPPVYPFVSLEDYEPDRMIAGHPGGMSQGQFNPNYHISRKVQFPKGPGPIVPIQRKVPRRLD